MAEQDLEQFNLIDPQVNSQGNTKMPPMEGDVMSGTPTSSAEVNFENIKEGLIVEGSDQPQGSFEIEGLDNAMAIHDMVSRFPVNATLSADPKDDDLNNDVFEKIVNEVHHELNLEGRKNEIQPLRFSIKGSNFDRYYNHPQFKNLGFHPHADN